ncbi:structure-specific endonuclease subunit SLX4 [Dendropsophus ebraccatus]|uniref:structure-specific endonuclease subunit SLX4 n=1 Tax=Dendropsophus ebraccatus TaxID=150705 RepID=UPI0038311760
MVESDDDFAELCSKLLKRVKKNNPQEGQNVPKVSTAARRTAKTKATGAKKQRKDGGGKEAEVGVIPKPDADKSDVNIEERKHTPTDGLLQKDGSRADSQIPGGDPRPLDQLSVKDLVLERMQQFKRTAPRRMKMDSTESSEAHVGSSAACPSVLDDGALALALQMDVKEKPASLEDEGLFFCQLCQKDLTAMSGALREQHVNRCLDQVENLGGGSVTPVVPSCPLCGKPFSTEKSRASHLKRCAAKLDVPAQTLLQAVQRQAAEAGSEVPPRVINGKRKGVPKQKAPAKKRKTAETGAEMEDLLVAMALSRSIQEDRNAQNINGGQPPPELPVRENKSRRKQKDKPTPLLLVQAPEETAERLQKRLSMLMTEETEEKGVITLPPSHFWSIEEEERESWRLRGGKRCVLWDISNMMEKRDTLSYYTAELNPTITPWKSPLKKLHSSQSAILYPGKPPSQPAADKDLQPVACEDKVPLSDSQKVLLDLADLAGEGITLTQWNSGASGVSEPTGPESPVTITCSGFIPAQEEKTVNERHAPGNKTPLLVLSADFMEMVNNPHLSDAQLQTDCGEVLSAHMFVLYARCPLLVEAIHSEGFWVDESGIGRARRLLLNDVTAEAALCFLRFLYSAVTDIPGHCLPHVSELARRFGVKSLIETCELLVSGSHSSEGEISTEEEEGDDGGERAETFQELLKSMWVDESEDIFGDARADEEDEGKLDEEGVGEGELEEIYEFALTQRKLLAEQETKDEGESEQEVGYQEKSEDNSSKSRNVSLEEREEMDIIPTPPLKVSPDPTDMECSPRKSPACLLSNSPEYSRSPAISSVQLRCQPSSSNSIAPGPSSRLDGTDASQTKPNSSASESPIPVISLISPNRDDDPEANFFAPHSPSPLDDSYDRMFSQTCGEYGEPSGIGESKSQINPSSPQHQQPILTSSPTAMPPCHELGSSPDIQPQTHSFLDRPSYSSERGKSLCSTFKDSHHSTSSSKGSSPKASTQDADIILILSSDEETEPNDQAAATTRSGYNPDIANAIKDSPVSFTQRRSSEGFSHLDISSSSDMSWLVPATPLHQSASSKTSLLQTLCSPQSPSDLQKRSCSAHSPPNTQKTSNATLSHQILHKTSHAALSHQILHKTSFATKSLPNSEKTSCVSMSPPHSQKTSCTAQSPKDLMKASPTAVSPIKKTSPTAQSPIKKTSPTAQSLIKKTSPTAPSPIKKTSSTASSPIKKTSPTAVSPIKKTSPTAQSPIKKTSPTAPSPIKKTSHTAPSPIKKTSPTAPSPNSWGYNVSPSPPKSQKTSQSSQTSRSFDMSSQSHVSHSQASPMSPPLISPKSPKTPQSLRPSERRHEIQSSGWSKPPSSPPISIASSTVFEVEDSEDEAPAAEPQDNISNVSFQFDYDEPPIPMEDDMWCNVQETPRKLSSSPAPSTPVALHKTPPKSQYCKPHSPSPAKSTTPGSIEGSPQTRVSQNSRHSYLNSRLWEDWEDEDPELPAVFPLSQRLEKVPDVQKLLKTPVSIVRKRELVPKVPITPLPDYSDMDTPVLKKELSKFGVRALPKKKMVLKLKEIFSYTHQVMNSDSEDDVPLSHPHPSKGSSEARVLQKPPQDKQQPQNKGKGSSTSQTVRKGTSVCAAREEDDRPLTASQESTASSVAASDTSSLSQSSNANEFETAFADEDDDEPVAASQAASKEAQTVEAVRRFIEAQPDLHRQILLYQPLDLSALHAELKQNGIKIAAGKLLDFLDSHCVTFTTAAARKEKQSRRRRKAGKRH